MSAEKLIMSVVVVIILDTCSLTGSFRKCGSSKVLLQLLCVSSLGSFIPSTFHSGLASGT